MCHILYTYTIDSIKIYIDKVNERTLCICVKTKKYLM